MANLKDYISGLVASVAQARCYADVQSAEIARRYKEDEILSFYSIPRMRVGDVEIELPYALDYLNAKSDSLILDENRTYNAIRSAICKTYSFASIPMTDVQSYNLLNDDVKAYATVTIISVRDMGYAYMETSAFSDLESRIGKWQGYLVKLGGSEKITSKELLDNVWNATLQSTQNTLSEGLEVIAEADKLAAFDSRVITRMKIKIHEDGLVWASSANGDILVTE